MDEKKPEKSPLDAIEELYDLSSDDPIMQQLRALLEEDEEAEGGTNRSAES